ncbi:MAG: PAS domain S-box protein [Calothrix sp. FI2-JRJ7]|jgi:PAS domain S-box-containing protein|nr:PAS domain S-box protein [Calothrix sp. FI2-JRJ7]
MTEVKAAISNHPSAMENRETVPLSESEERFRLVLEASPDGFIILRSVLDAAGEIDDFQIEYTNLVAARGVNRTPEELLGEYLLHLFPDCKTSGTFARYVTVAETGISATFETFYDSKDLTGWFRNVVVKLNDGIAVSFSDITDRKQAELALQQQEQHFRVALQTAKLGSWEHDLTTGVLTCSDQCKANFGLAPDAEFTHETLFAALHPDDRPLVQAAIARSIEERKDYEVEERCYHPDGSLHWLIVQGKLVYDSKGTPIRMVGVTLDITERKQFEESLQAANQRTSNILESITDAFIAFDRDWRYTYVNQEAARMLGRSPQELLGQRWQEVFSEVTQQNSVIVQQFEQAMAEQITVRFEAFSLITNRWLDVSLFPSPDGLAMYFRDISDRKRAEQRRDVQYAITHILAEAKTVAEATPAILQALCEYLGWQVGALWRFDSHPPILRCINYWQAPNVDMQKFVEATQQITFVQGAGLPGRVWASRQPHWICEISKESNFPRITLASQVGLQSGFGFPILLGDEILGVIECFSQRIQEPDEDLLDMMAAIGSQIGQFIERKRTETALRESQELFERFMNHSPIAAFIKDASGRYLYANSWVERVYGHPQSDLIGKTDFELLPLTIAQQFYKNDMTVLTNGQPMQMLETIQHEDGEHSYMSFKFPFHNAAGQKLLAGVALDISDRLRAEEELRQREAEVRLITNAVPVLISFIDAQQRYRFNNQKYEEWFGNPATKVYGKHMREVLGDAAYETIRAYVEQVLAGQEVTFESKVPYKDGATRFVSATYVPRVDQQGNLEGFVALVSDITQRKQAEESLRQSEERLRIAQKAANAGVWDWDIVANQVTWSEEYYRLYGLERATTQPSYENWLKAIVEQDRERADQAARKALAQRTDLNVEFRILHPTQGERWLTAIGQTFYNDNGQPKRMTGIALDITERKQAEQALRQSEEQAQLAIKVARLGTWRYNLHSDLVELDKRMREIWGEPDNASTIPLPRVMERIHPHDRERVASSIGAALAPGSSGTYEIDYRIIWDDGTERWVSANGQVQFEGEGKSRQAIEFFGTTLDITDRKQAEEALRNSAERLSVALSAAKLGDWSWNAATDIVTFSQRGAEIFGIPPGPYMTWTQMQSLLPEKDRERARLRVEQAVAKQEDYDIEYQVSHPDGTLRWVAAKGRAQYEPSGYVLGMLGVVQDVTARKQAEQEREQLLERERAAREQAENANRIKDEFLAVLSHELRSPLNPILGWTRLLQTRQFDQSGTKRALETIERNAKLQTQLIDDLLDISRILRGKMMLNVCLVDLSVLINAALETVRLSAEAKGIEIQKIVADNIGLVCGDSTRLQQILWNLLSNAVKFTPSGGKIEIRLEQVSTDAQIQVKDTGKGITPEFLPHVFEYFRQEDSTTTRKFGGLGLGLAIVRYFTELHGGTVKAESPGEGLGATFTFSLPISKNENGGKTDETVSASDVAEASPLAKKRILVVDDEADMRELIFTILQQTGAEIKVTASAFEALEALDIFKPDVLISDIGMPEMDGYGLMHQLRSLPPERRGRIPALALTAYAGEINQQQALAAGFQKHIAKPVEPEELVKAILTLVK